MLNPSLSDQLCFTPWTSNTSPIIGHKKFIFPSRYFLWSGMTLRPAKSQRESSQLYNGPPDRSGPISASSYLQQPRRSINKTYKRALTNLPMIQIQKKYQTSGNIRDRKPLFGNRLFLSRILRDHPTSRLFTSPLPHSSICQIQHDGQHGAT